MDVRVRQRKAGQDRGNALVGERRHDRQRAAAADEERPGPDRALERVKTELDGRRFRIDETGRCGREAGHLQLRALRRRLPQQPLGFGRDLLRVLPRGKPDREVRVRLDR